VKRLGKQQLPPICSVLLAGLLGLAAAVGVYCVVGSGPSRDGPAIDDVDARRPVGPREVAQNRPGEGPSEAEPPAPSSQPYQPTLNGPIDRPFKVDKPYVDKKGRIINPNDCDGDALPDDWEMRRYGTLRYDASNCMSARRIDLPGRKTDPNDTDRDGLPDEWEKKYFGHLQLGRDDDPDEDGYPNWVEYEQGRYGATFDPTKVNLIDPKHKPKRLGRTSGRPGSFSTDTLAFWRKQKAARTRLGKSRNTGARPTTKAGPTERTGPTSTPAHGQLKP